MCRSKFLWRVCGNRSFPIDCSSLKTYLDLNITTERGSLRKLLVAPSGFRALDLVLETCQIALVSGAELFSTFKANGLLFF